MAKSVPVYVNLPYITVIFLTKDIIKCSRLNPQPSVMLSCHNSQHVPQDPRSQTCQMSFLQTQPGAQRHITMGMYVTFSHLNHTHNTIQMLREYEGFSEGAVAYLQFFYL